MARAPRKKKEALQPVGATGNLSHDNTRNELTADQRQALFFQHMKKISALQTKMASINGEIRSAYKVAKSEGFPKKDFDFAFMLEKDEDDKAANDRRREAEIARWLGHAIGTQADLFEAGGTQPSQHENGFAEGKRQALSGEPCKPDYAPGTDGYDGYMKGWHEGAAIKSNMASEQEQGDTLLRRESNQPASTDAFDSAAENGGEKKWPDEAQVESRKETEPA